MMSLNPLALIDTHCHLVSEKLRDDIPALLLRAQEAGVRKLLNVAYDVATSELAQNMASQYPMVFASVGIQPHDSQQYTPAVAERLQLLAAAKKVIAIGEIGLDYYHDICPKDMQIPCFEHFLQIAVELRLPVVKNLRNEIRCCFLVSNLLQIVSQIPTSLPKRQRRLLLQHLFATVLSAILQRRIQFLKVILKKWYLLLKFLRVKVAAVCPNLFYEIVLRIVLNV